MNRNYILFGAALIAGAAACSEERALLSDPAAPEAYGFQLLGPSANLPRGSAAFTGTGLTVTLLGLDSLSSGFYTAWMGDSLGTTFTRATGTLSTVRVDTTFDADGNPLGTPTTIALGTASAFSNGGPNQTFTWTFTGAPSATFLVTVEGSNAAASPSGSRRPLWARRAATTSPTVTRSLSFGNYGGADALDDYIFVGSARGRAAFQQTMVMGNDSSMSRPPIGYYYAMWLVKRPIGATSGGDTIALGEQTSPWPRRHLSQFNADSIITDAAVVTNIPRAILAGSARLDADTVSGLLNPGGTAPACESYGCPFLGYNEFWVTLENKYSTSSRMGVARLLLGSIPAVVTTGAKR